MPKINLHETPEQNLWQISIKLKYFFKAKKNKEQDSICLMPIIAGIGISAHNTCEGQAAQENFWNEIERTNDIIQSLIKCEVIKKNPTISKELTQIFNQDKSGFIPLHVSESDKTDENDFFRKNNNFKCWIQHSGSEKMLYLAIYPMPDSQESDRERITQKIISKYKPPCNTD